jgi:mannose-1-phosphate guanylyltransferase
VHDLIIVSTDDALLICPKDRDQDVRELVKMLQQRGQTEYL